jgi:hypothetical protein
MKRASGWSAAAALWAAFAVPQAHAADGSFEVYGFLMLDYIQDFGRVNPDWEDTLRPSRIGTDEDQFGDEGQAILSVKQSRLGVQATLPVDGQDLYTKFEFDMFGTGDDAGQTTIRLRHAYGQWGQFLAGQTNSLFMDIDVFPNVIDYWGPNGMVFLRNPQIRWTPISGDMSFAIAIENPGNDIDAGQFREVPNFPGAQADNEYPDFTAQWRMKTSFGHVQVAGILRYISTEVVGDGDPGPGVNNEVLFDDNDLGWGIDLTTVINLFEKDAIRLGFVGGEGIASYMNDGGMDAGPDRPPGDPAVGIDAVELIGVTAYYDRWWNERWTSSIGYAFTDVDNTDGQTPDTFKHADYASMNLLHYPAKNIMVGVEALWGKLEDFGNNDNDDTRIQVSFKYNFSSNDFRERL